MDSGRGLPVTLSLLYVSLARKVGWSATCLNVPGHVLIRIGEYPGAVIMDPFDEGRILDDRGMGRMVARLIGPNATAAASAFPAMGNRATLVRLLIGPTVPDRIVALEHEVAALVDDRQVALGPQVLDPDEVGDDETERRRGEEDRRTKQEHDHGASVPPARAVAPSRTEGGEPRWLQCFGRLEIGRAHV